MSEKDIRGLKAQIARLENINANTPGGPSQGMKQEVEGLKLALRQAQGDQKAMGKPRK